MIDGERVLGITGVLFRNKAYSGIKVRFGELNGEELFPLY